VARKRRRPDPPALPEGTPRLCVETTADTAVNPVEPPSPCVGQTDCLRLLKPGDGTSLNNAEGATDSEIPTKRKRGRPAGSRRVSRTLTPDPSAAVANSGNGQHSPTALQASTESGSASAVGSMALASLRRYRVIGEIMLNAPDDAKNKVPVVSDAGKCNEENVGGGRDELPAKRKRGRPPGSGCGDKSKQKRQKTDRKKDGRKRAAAAAVGDSTAAPWTPAKCSSASTMDAFCSALQDALGGDRSVATSLLQRAQPRTALSFYQPMRVNLPPASVRERCDLTAVTGNPSIH